MINFTNSIDNTFVATEPNFYGTGHISLDFNLTEDEVAEMTSARKCEMLSTKDSMYNELEYVKSHGCIEITQTDYEICGRIEVAGNGIRDEYYNIILTDSEQEVVFSEMARAAGGIKKLTQKIIDIQLGAEKASERIKERIPERRHKKPERELER